MILVAGGAGYIGSHCVKELLAQGYEVVALDNLSQGHRDAVLTKHFVEADLRDRGALQDAFQRYEIDAVVHFAGLSQVGESMSKPLAYYDNNVLGTMNLLHVMMDHEVKRIVFSSSAAVYGIPERTPIPEDHPKDPISPYGQTKWIVEKLLEDCEKAYGIRYVALRYFNAAGCDPDGELAERHDPETHLVPIVLDVALGKGEQVAIFGTDYSTPDGTCIRDYIHVCDLAVAHVKALERLERLGASGVYNLGIGHGYPVREVIAVCQNISGRGIRVAETERRSGDPAELVADSRRATKELSWKPRYTNLDEIARTAWNDRGKRARMGGRPSVTDSC
jgi:UDP-glucose 4-epimerase